MARRETLGEVSGISTVYEAEADELGHGASLGNGHCWVTTGTDGRVQSLFSTDVGQEVAGPLLIRYASAELHGACQDDEPTAEARNLPLVLPGAGRFVMHPAWQAHRFELPGGVEVDETTFLPLAEPDAGEEGCAVCVMVRLRNGSETERRLSVYAFARMRGGVSRADVTARYDMRRRAVFARDVDNADWARVLASPGGCTRGCVTDDLALAYESDSLPLLSGKGEVTGNPLGCLEHCVTLRAGEETVLTLVLSFDPRGERFAWEAVSRFEDATGALAASEEVWRRRLESCQIATPDRAINEGALWAKVNMLRVLAHYPRGRAFTNEPGVSSNVVARDAVWFVYGCDHFLPRASRELLEALCESQYDNGMIPEYYDARDGRTEDYGLNINDGTPLFVLGLNHHARSTGDMGWLRGVYDRAAAACRYILSQRDERGLIDCSAEGVEVYGICSWRNVIPNYRINGAVTEINAECAAALRAMGHMAENVGRDDEGEEFAAAARELTEAINAHLLDEQRGLYLLNIDPAGVRHTDVTADEVFPVLFRVAPEEVAYRIIRRLNSPDFWTPAGLRTASRLDPQYDPARYVGLIGGVWPGMTWWYAFAAARYHPEFMVDALRAAYQHYLRAPRQYHTVPGQFSEWFDGESLVNRGMRLSPWEPPRFLWAAVEGVCGMMVLPGEPKINPLLPPEWKWSAARSVPYHGESISFFTARMDGRLHVYADTDFDTDDPKHIYGRDVTDRLAVDHPGIHPLALAADGRLAVVLGSCRQDAAVVPLVLDDLLDAEAEYTRRQWHSERGAWEEGPTATGREVSRRSVRVEAGGFHLLELRPKR